MNRKCTVNRESNERYFGYVSSYNIHTLAVLVLVVLYVFAQFISNIAVLC